MSDLLAGTDVLDLDTPPTVWDVQNDSFSFDATVFGVDADSGTYNTCGVVFTACTTGRAEIAWRGRLANNTVNQGTLLTPVVRVGGSIGSGASVHAASDNDALQYNASSSTGAVAVGDTLIINGLTPGDTYNVRLEHRVGGNTGTISRRRVSVKPCT